VYCVGIYSSGRRIRRNYFDPDTRDRLRSHGFVNAVLRILVGPVVAVAIGALQEQELIVASPIGSTGLPISVPR